MKISPYFTFYQKELFGTIGRAFTKSLAMTIGEFGFEEIFYSKQSKSLPLITWFLFVVFLLVMTILLMNMLVSKHFVKNQQPSVIINLNRIADYILRNQPAYINQKKNNKKTEKGSFEHFKMKLWLLI